MSRDPSPAPSRSMTAYDQFDALLYDHHASGLEGDIGFYVEEAKQAGSGILELGCGTGRILVPTAQAGVPIIGLDRAPAMLALAEQKLAALPPAVRDRVSLIQADMRDFRLDAALQLITVPYRAFLHLLTLKDQRRTLACIHRHLAPRGRLILDIFDPDIETLAAHSGPLGPVLKQDRIFQHPHTGRRVISWEARRYDLERQLLEQSTVFEEVDTEGRSLSRTHRSLTLRYVFRYEMRHLLELAGFRVEALYGDFQRGPFSHGGEQIWIARKVETERKPL